MARPRNLADQVLALHGKGFWNIKIARKLGCNHATVTHHLRKAGLTRNEMPLGLLSPTLLRKVSAAHQAGAVPYEIAERVKKSEPTVRKYLKALGLKPHKPHKPHKPPRKRTRKHSGPQVFPLFCRASVGPKLEQAAAGAMALVAEREVARLRRRSGGPI